MKLGNISSKKQLEIDILARTLTIYHNGKRDLIKERIASLNFDSSLIKTEEFDFNFTDDDSDMQRNSYGRYFQSILAFL